MLKTLFSTICFFCISTTSFAAQCPSPDDWQHQKGFAWSLKSQFVQAGWQIYQKNMNDTTLTAIPPQTPLTINVLPDRVQCNYDLGSVSKTGTLMAFQMNKIDLSKLKQPPFYRAFIGFICDTTANAPRRCAWQ